MKLIIETDEEPAPRRSSGLARFKRLQCSRVDPVNKAASQRKNRHKIRRDMVTMKRQIQVEGVREMSKMLKVFFHRKLNAIADRVAKHAKSASWDRKAETELDFGANEEIWRDAIMGELGDDAGVELALEYRPIAQSAAAKAAERTQIILGDLTSPPDAQALYVRVTQLARDVTGINQTTADRLETSIYKAMEDGMTLSESVAWLRDAIPEIADGRIPTIARTEIGRSIDAGTIQSMQDSQTVTHCQVIGCQAIEAHIPELDGTPTCGIAGVPVDRLDELSWHVNHTGTLVAQYFIDDNYDGGIYSDLDG